ncbi:MAG: multidrug efflux pump subunit AcrB, partial [Planctomycetota bacterium]
MEPEAPDSPNTDNTKQRPSQGRGFFAVSVRRPVGFLVAYLTLILTGALAYRNIPIQLLPSGLQGTRLQVWIDHPGSSASENEEKVTRLLEDQFQTLPGLADFWSTSRDSGVFIGVKFNGAADMNLAKAELRDRIERARPLLPTTVQRIFVWANDDGDPPVMWFALLADRSTEDMDYLVENEVQRRLEGCDGVSKVTIFGLLNDSIRILLDEEKVKAARLDIGNLIQRLQRDNFAKPLGEITDGGRRFLLRSDMRFEDFEQVADYPLGNGLRLGDIATVERVKTVRDRLARIDGRDAYYGMIQKESSANVVEVSKNIWAAVHEFETDPKLAGRLKLNALFDQAAFIETSLNGMRRTAVWGGGLAVLVLFVFLRRIRMTLCVALSIPTAALLSIAYEHFTGGSFNVLTMAGLTLALGMLVDNAVVVVENIARLKKLGMSGRDAAVEGVRDVGLAIALATLTSVVVFMPLMFMGDNPQIRVMMMALGLPLCTALLFSLFVALVFLPVITARVLGERPAFIERAGVPMSRLASLPVRGVAQVVGLARWFVHRSLTFGHRLERIALVVLMPLRWPLSIAVVAYAGYRMRVLPELNSLQKSTTNLGLQVDGIQSDQGLLISNMIMAVVAAALLLIGVPRWHRRKTGAPAQPEHFRPQGTSMLAWMVQTNHRALAWTIDHRYMATFLAFGAFFTVLIPMNGMTIAAFGQEEDLLELEIDVEVEDNFTLAETSEEFEKYEEFLEGYRDELGFAHLVVRFGSGGGELSIRWEDRLDP